MRRTLRPRVRRVLLAAAVAALPALLAACGSRAGEGHGPARSSAAPASSAAPRVFRFRLREEPPTVDPAQMTDNLSEAIVMNVFRGLVAMDPATLAVVPAVAASWTVSPDHLTYTFRLRDGVAFHNGRAVEAKDVVWSFERLLKKETHSPRRWLLEPVAGALEFAEGKAPSVAGLTAPDPGTVVLRLERPFAPFLGMLTMGGAAIVPREVYEDPEKKYLHAPVGCGPFKVVRWEPSSLIEMAAFDRYYDGRPAVDLVQVRIIENQVTAFQEYRTGGLDSLDEVPNDLPPEVQPEVLRYPLLGVGYIGLNLDRPPFKGNTALRQAINYAVDKEYLWTRLMPGANVPGRGLIPPGIAGYDPGLPGYPHDEARARSLLAQSGYPAGRGLAPIALWFNTSGDNRRIAEQVQADLRKIGVTLTLREVDWAAYLKAVEGTVDTSGEAQMFRFGWSLDYPDADAVLRPLLHSKNIGPAGNYFRYRNPAVDDLVDRALVIDEPAARADLYRKAERIAVMEDAPMLFLNYFGSMTLFKPYVKGVTPTPLGEFRIPLERLYLEKPSPTPA
ncbi:MAG TPA: ABC transporter substrate-binding protein [Candidatus Polarisedimenticolia bacterium]|nr:ABC transporter substrate-binding protein [Candidatus Polarisedimenticolia bacterium]